MNDVSQLIVDDFEDAEPAFDGSTEIDHGLSSIAWRQYDADVKKAAGFTPAPMSKQFDNNGYFFGCIDPEVAEKAFSSVIRSRRTPLINDDHDPAYITYAFPSDSLNDTNRASAFRQFDAQARWAIEDALDSLKDDVAACLGTPWKTVTVRAWSTRPASAAKGGYGWHSDGYIPELYKILLYLTPLSPETGSIEIRSGGKTVRRRYDRRGAYALFDNTRRVHRGVAGSLHERVVVDATICRSVKFDIRLRSPGQNSHWPKYPWVDEIYRCSASDLHKIDAARGALPTLYAPVEKPKGGFARLLSR